ncbi:MAG: Na+:solute symporter [Saprospiraceae bacterium]|nr:Na+:solute symporter [Saprospiraceae bacterium]
MNIQALDWTIIAGSLVLVLAIGLYYTKRSGKNPEEFFLSGRDMPWWLLGFSMVATTFSADTPNLVTDIVRKDGVAGNWAWWAFLLTGMLTVYLYSKFWRRSGITTDLEFYELRYSGKPAAFLRGFRAIYLGFFFNIMIMATVMLAGVKIGSIMLGASPIQTIVAVSVFTVLYSSLGGFKGVVMTDFVQFIIAMIGSVGAAIAIVRLPEIGSVDALVSHELVKEKLQFFPDPGTDTFVTVLIIPIAVQWWSVWYPGAEPGGGGYIAQRMLSAKDEDNAQKATLFFNFAHYALRPWPWIIIALASLIIFPELSDLETQFPNVDKSLINDDLAYPAMLSYLPKGLLGVVIASLVMALMSTISTHLNWGASYLTQDFYKRFVNPTATNKQLINFGRLTTLALMVFTALLVPFLESAKNAFGILLQIGAGTGLLFILRWFWYRIHAISELTAMIVSFLVAIALEIVLPNISSIELEGHHKLVIGVAITTIAWVAATLLYSPPSEKALDQELSVNDQTLIRFVELIKPYPMGWKKFLEKTGRTDLIDQCEGGFSKSILKMVIGTLAIYSLLFGIGSILYGNMLAGLILLSISLIGAYILLKVLK